MSFFLIISLVGIVATIFTLCSTVPQIIKGVRTKKMDDVSVWLIFVLIIGLSFWVIYGILRSDMVIVGGNTAGVTLNAILLVLKIKYSRHPMS
ncbi:MAG TPA: SemiSWEET family transporter [Nitrososphaeraceae archaeon]|jgi:MtN3 and saliva related transmembrane protein|nr:SemiSWEET family transporter [Nitrososphaeraceae archaeon]